MKSMSARDSLRAGAEQHRKSRAGHPRGSLEIQNAERGTQIPVRLRREVERARLSPGAHHLLSAALFPSGTLACGRFGHDISSADRCCST